MRLEPVMTAQRDEPLRLDPVAALQDPGHRRLEVVILDQGGHAAEMGEGQHVPFQERLLRLGAERGMKRPPRTRQPHHEQPALDQHPGQEHAGLAEVDLRFGPRLVALRHHHLGPVQAQLGPPPRDIPRHSHLGQHRAVLGDQPLPDPPGRVPLLPRQLLISDQPAIDHLRPRIDRRPGPARIRLPRRRQRAGQRLAHRPPVHLMPLRQRPDRQPLNPAIPPDHLEDLHPRSHPLADLPSQDHDRKITPRGGARIRADTSVRGRVSSGTAGNSLLILLRWCWPGRVLVRLALVAPGPGVVAVAGPFAGMLAPARADARAWVVR